MSKARDLANFGDDISDGVISAALDGDGSSLSNLPIKPIGQKEFTATGDILQGNTVILNDDGTVSIISPVTIDEFAKPESVYYFNHWSYNEVSGTYVFRGFDTNYDILLIAAKVINGQLTFGTPVILSGYTSSANGAIEFDRSTNTFVLVFGQQASPYYPRVVAGTLNGTSITLGSVYQLDSVRGQYGHRIASNNNGTFVISRYVTYTPYGLRAQAITVSGTSISIGSYIVVTTDDSVGYGHHVVYDEQSDRFVQVWGNYTPDSFQNTYIATYNVSGTSLSINSATSLNSFYTHDVKYDSTNGQLVLVGSDRYSYSVSKYIMTASVSGTSVTTTSPVLVTNKGYSKTSTEEIGISVKNSTFILNYKLGLNAWAFRSGSLSSGQVTLNDDELEHENATVNKVEFFEGGPEVITQKSYNFIVSNPSGSYGKNWIGIASEDILDGQSGNITIGGGTATGLSGLTSGSKYIINKVTGSLDETTLAPDAIAVSGTELFLLNTNKPYDDLLEEIANVTFTSQSTSAYINFTDLDLGKYSKVVIAGTTQTTSSNTLTVQNVEIASSYSVNVNVALYLDGVTMSLNPILNIRNKHKHYTTNLTKVITVYSGTYNSYFTTGTNLTLYGVR